MSACGFSVIAYCSVRVQGVLAGQAVAGVAVSALSFVTLWATPVSGAAAKARSLALPAFLYFAAATATMVVCAFGYTSMWRWPYVKAYWGNAGECPYDALQVTLHASVSCHVVWSSVIQWWRCAHTQVLRPAQLHLPLPSQMKRPANHHSPATALPRSMASQKM